MSAKKGEEREKHLDESVYYSQGYFELTQLCSLAHQISDIGKLKPTSVLEIGIGNGMTSNFLRKAGIDVVTVDINPNLKPDICCSIDELVDNLGGRKFDLLVCCEVLEHLPFHKFEASIAIFSSISDRLYLTLPNYRKSIGFGGFFRLRHAVRKWSLMFEYNNGKRLPEEHYWEIGYSIETGIKNIIKLIKQHYTIQSVSKYVLNPYHTAIVAYKVV